MNWLLLRGLAREQRHWYGFVDLFRARAGVSRVVLVDLAGVGTEHRRSPQASVAWMARDVARRVPGLATPGISSADWSVVGVSLGGMVALELCRLYPERIQRGVIVNASSCLSSAWARLRPGAALELLRAALSDDPVQRERRVLALTSRLPEAQRDNYARAAAEFARDAPTSRRSLLVQLMAAARFVPPERGQLVTRLAFACARNDALVNPRCSRDLAAHYDATTEMHPWAGHDLPLDDPEWLCEHIVGCAAAPRIVCSA
jgi:pimeloyl-[acyl-carrier protein] methyl ester esterase